MQLFFAICKINIQLITYDNGVIKRMEQRKAEYKREYGESLVIIAQLRKLKETPRGWRMMLHCEVFCVCAYAFISIAIAEGDAHIITEPDGYKSPDHTIGLAGTQ